ncbi:hypothetical protein GCM10027053_05480 [Intrasporangium mesophilum]
MGTVTQLPTAATTAWAPFRRLPDFLHERDRRATKWVLGKARAEGLKPVLFVVSHASHFTTGDGAIPGFARQADISTHRSPRGRGPGLIPWANGELIEDADGRATGGLCLTEHPTFPLIGWAMHTGALDLMTGAITEDTRKPEHVKEIESLEDMSYNGWHSSPGKYAKGGMAELAGDGLTWSVFVGSLAAINPRRAHGKDLDKLLPTAWKDEKAELLHDAMRGPD